MQHVGHALGSSGARTDISERGARLLSMEWDFLARKTILKCNGRFLTAEEDFWMRRKAVECGGEISDRWSRSRSTEEKSSTRRKIPLRGERFLNAEEDLWPRKKMSYRGRRILTTEEDFWSWRDIAERWQIFLSVDDARRKFQSVWDDLLLLVYIVCAYFKIGGVMNSCASTLVVCCLCRVGLFVFSHATEMPTNIATLSSNNNKTHNRQSTQMSESGEISHAIPERSVFSCRISGLLSVPKFGGRFPSVEWHFRARIFLAWREGLERCARAWMHVVCCLCLFSWVSVFVLVHNSKVQSSNVRSSKA